MMIEMQTAGSLTLGFLDHWTALTNNQGKQEMNAICAAKRLRRKGFTDVVPMRNESNHGIDYVCRSKKGDIVFIEVKGHYLDRPIYLPRSQREMKRFCEERLELIAGKKGRYANVSQEVSAQAANILEEMGRQKPFRGIAINVDYALSWLPKIRYYEWAQGIGPLINP